MINVGDLSHKICNKSATNLQNTGKTIIPNLTLLIYKQAVVKKYGAIFFLPYLYGPSFSTPFIICIQHIILYTYYISYMYCKSMINQGINIFIFSDNELQRRKLQKSYHFYHLNYREGLFAYLRFFFFPTISSKTMPKCPIVRKDQFF